MIELVAALIMQICKEKVPEPRDRDAMVACFDVEVNKLKFDKNGNLEVQK